MDAVWRRRHSVVLTQCDHAAGSPRPPGPHGPNGKPVVGQTCQQCVLSGLYSAFALSPHRHRMALGTRDEDHAHPHPAAPRCISCHTSSPRGTASEGSLAPQGVDDGGGAKLYRPPRVCGTCSVDQACKPLTSAGKQCDMPSAHGGGVSLGSCISRGVTDYR